MKIFSTTMFAQRQQLAETVTEWLSGQPELELVDLAVTQSSDIGHHCLTISVFYREPSAPTALARKGLGGVR